MADSLARSVMSSQSITTEIYPVEDYLHEMNMKLVLQWQRCWENEVLVKGKGKDLFAIKNTLEKWSWAHNSIRTVEASLARLRSGHVGLAKYLHRFNMQDSPLCNCGEIETVKHFLLECPRFQHNRSNLIDDLRDIGVTVPLSLKLLLGGTTYPSPVQFKIVNAVSKYLQDTHYLHQL